jgi:putative ABC transport system substrate-binding protein
LKKLLAWGMMFVLLLAVVTGCGESSSNTGGQQDAEKKVKLGIIQVAEHPALDAAREVGKKTETYHFKAIKQAWPRN